MDDVKAACDEQAKAKQQFASALRQKSQQLYGQTKRSYGEPVARMDTAAASTDPVPTRFKNRVLFIKGNLNAQAIASLKGPNWGSVAISTSSSRTWRRASPRPTASSARSTRGSDADPPGAS